MIDLIETQADLNGYYIVGTTHKFSLLEVHKCEAYNITYLNGSRYWFKYGHFHRTDGPAIIFFQGETAYYLNGKKLSCNSQKEFEQLMRLKAFW